MPARVRLLPLTVLLPAPVIAVPPFTVSVLFAIVLAPLQLKAPLTVTAPVPLSVPPDRLSALALSDPFAVSVPLNRVNVLLMLELRVPRVSVPPLIVSASSLCNCAAFCAPVFTVIVWLPATLITAASLASGARARLHFVPSDQSPPPPSHVSTTSAPAKSSRTLFAL